MARSEPDFEAARQVLVRSGCGYNDPTNRQSMKPNALAGRRTAIFVTLGQSQTTNTGDTPFAPPARVFNLNPFDGRIYHARDPLLGCTDDRGGFASRLGHLLVTEEKWDDVVLLPIGVAGSSIKEWLPDDRYHHRMVAAIGCLRAAGLQPTAVLWAQGEADAVPGAQADEYRTRLTEVITSLRSLAVAAPIFVAVSSFCHMMSDGNAAIRSAQRGESSLDRILTGSASRSDMTVAISTMRDCGRLPACGPTF
jgi:hypothetical protein